jgi:hypothetical protein
VDKKPVRIAVATALGREFQKNLQPVLNDEIAIQKFVEQDCGADGWTLTNGKLIALRDNGDGSHAAIKTYEIDSFGRA